MPACFQSNLIALYCRSPPIPPMHFIFFPLMPLTVVSFLSIGEVTCYQVSGLNDAELRQSVEGYISKKIGETFDSKVARTFFEQEQGVCL